MKEYTREDLIKICEQAFVPENKWHDRDSSSTQQQLGECYAFLKDGCEYEIREEDSSKNAIVLDVYTKGFCWFESFEEPKDRTRDNKEKHIYFYLPTQERLDEANGGDWY